MKNNRQNRVDENARREPLSNDMERNSSVPGDLPDSQEDRRKLEPTSTTIDLPDVKDIPGQEFINIPASLGEMADTTMASADEEGDAIFDDGDDDDDEGEFDVSEDEKNTLERTDYMPTTDEDNLQRASLDSTDFEGEPLNEKGFGETPGDTVDDSDLDIDAEDETDTEAMGQGDEENKSYSLGSDDSDNFIEGSPE